MSPSHVISLLIVIAPIACMSPGVDTSDASTGSNSNVASSKSPSSTISPTTDPNTQTPKVTPAAPNAAQPNAVSNANTTADANHPTSGPTVRTLGRFDSSDPNLGNVFNWPASSIFTRVLGTGLSIKLAPIGTETYQGKTVTSMFDVFIDGQKTNTISLVPGVTSYVVAQGLTNADHIVQVSKRTEAQMGTSVFSGFVPSGNATLLPAPLARSRRIEFIGDSITAGYGADGNVANYSGCPNFTIATENADSTFASMTAASFGAEYMAIAWSGKGIYQNDDCYGDPNYTLPVLYPSSVPLVTDTNWDFRSWVPQAVVINLGTNDYNMNNGCAVPSSAKFTAAWVSFLKTVRNNYPDAYILCTVGPELQAPNLAIAEANIQAAVATQVAAGDSNVAFVSIPVDSGDNGYGCGGHPNQATHAIMAKVITQALSAAVKW